MSSITWSIPSSISASISTDNRYWVTSQTAITDTVTHTPKLIIPGVTYRRKISIFLPLPVASTLVIPVRLWINPPADFINTDAIEGHHWIYAGQNIADYEISDPVWMACLEPSDTNKVIVKIATLSE